MSSEPGVTVNGDQPRSRIVLCSLADLSASIGEAVTSVRTARTFARLGHDVTLLAPAPTRAGTVVDAAPARVRFTYNVRRLGLPNSLNTVVQLAVVLGMAARREFDAVYVRAASLTFLFGLCLRLVPSVTVISEHHGWLAAERGSNGRRVWLASLERLLQVWDARLAQRVRTVVPGIRDRLVAGGVDGERVLVVGNAADTDAITPLPRDAALLARGLPLDRQYLGFLGSLTPWQGLEEMIEGFALLAARNPRVQLLLFGAGPGQAELERLVAVHGLAARVVFGGRVSHEQVGAALACFDVALLPTHVGAYAEIGRSPLKLREYAAAGRPVLAARIDVVDELESEPWVSFYPLGDMAAFAACAADMLAEPGRLAAAGASARRYAEVNYAWPVIGARILAGLPLSAAPGRA